MGKVMLAFCLVLGLAQCAPKADANAVATGAEAKPAADPFVAYGSYGNYGGSRNYGGRYGSYGGSGRGYGGIFYGRKKRNADAEADRFWTPNGAPPNTNNYGVPPTPRYGAGHASHNLPPNYGSRLPYIY